MQTQLMLDQIQDATATANTVAKQEREAVSNLDAALREADNAIQKELERILSEQMMRRAEILTLVEKIRSGLGAIDLAGKTPPPVPEDMPKLLRKAKEAV